MRRLDEARALPNSKLSPTRVVSDRIQRAEEFPLYLWLGPYLYHLGVIILPLKDILAPLGLEILQCRPRLSSRSYALPRIFADAALGQIGGLGVLGAAIGADEKIITCLECHVYLQSEVELLCCLVWVDVEGRVRDTAPDLKQVAK